MAKYPRSRRLRKKLHLVEFKELGFYVESELKVSTPISIAGLFGGHLPVLRRSDFFRLNSLCDDPSEIILGTIQIGLHAGAVNLDVTESNEHFGRFLGAFH